MSYFIGDLDVRLVDDQSNEGRGTWKLLAAFGFHSDKYNRDFVTAAGQTTDFASIPRQPLIFLVAGDRGHKAAVIHDGLYQTHEVDRETADRVLEEALITEGFTPEEAYSWYLGVHWGGEAHWDNHIAPIGAGAVPGPQLPLGNLV